MGYRAPVEHNRHSSQGLQQLCSGVAKACVQSELRANGPNLPHHHRGPKIDSNLLRNNMNKLTARIMLKIAAATKIPSEPSNPQALQ